MGDSPDAAALVALVGWRIAHDLASPVGAIANGVELLGLTGLGESPEIALITESVENASARIKLFRIAFGAAAAAQVVPPAQIAALTAPARDGRRLEIDWRISGDIARTDAKLALLALMCMETAMPWGGRATVSRQDGQLHITASTGKMNAAPALWDHLAGNGPVPAELAAAQVQFALLPAEARAQGRRLQITQSPGGLKISV